MSYSRSGRLAEFGLMFFYGIHTVLLYSSYRSTIGRYRYVIVATVGPVFKTKIKYYKESRNNGIVIGDMYLRIQMPGFPLVSG